ncbi:luciferin sulfotransferase-like [Phlebotomus papatasi]|uniref:luciferin sulfotransferase-like n=1 Tax=Phlebotomus papatasi TaxID=29031 RepID=UPI0024844018|nr:luciferin sulfotransferase-like [Phlebotomus papatasi]
MPIVWEKFRDEEKEVEKVKYAGMEEFIIAKNTSYPDVPQASLWLKDQTHFLPGLFQDTIETLYNFQVRPDDVWVVTFPKSGTTWVQEMVWQICNDLDYERSKQEHQMERFPYLELNCLFPKHVNFPNTVTALQETKSRRFIKSHLPAPLLPKQIWTVKPRIIYVARNVKDVAISFYHFYRNVHHYPGSWEDFFDIFMKNRVYFAPYHTHVYNYWRMRNEDNILFLTFEEMKKDHPSVIRKTAQFLGKSFSENQILELADYLSFSKFSKITTLNHDTVLHRIQDELQTKLPDKDYHFVRKGEVGSYKVEMPKEVIEEFNRWTLKEIEKAKMDPDINRVFYNV